MIRSLTEARAAKEKVLAQLGGLPELRGVGIALLADDYAVRVNLSKEIGGHVIPVEVDGVPILVEIVGDIGSL